MGEGLLEGDASTGPGLLGLALGEKRLLLPFGSFSQWGPLGEGVISAHVVVRFWLEVPRTHPFVLVSDILWHPGIPVSTRGKDP